MVQASPKLRLEQPSSYSLQVAGGLQVQCEAQAPHSINTLMGTHLPSIATKIFTNGRIGPSDLFFVGFFVIVFLRQSPVTQAGLKLALTSRMTLNS